MKWYIEYLIIWTILFITGLLLFTSDTDPLPLRLLIALVMGTLVSSIAYASYHETKKQK